MWQLCKKLTHSSCVLISGLRDSVTKFTRIEIIIRLIFGADWGNICFKQTRNLCHSCKCMNVLLVLLYLVVALLWTLDRERPVCCHNLRLTNCALFITAQPSPVHSTPTQSTEHKTKQLQCRCDQRNNFSNVKVMSYPYFGIETLVLFMLPIQSISEVCYTLLKFIEKNNLLTEEQPVIQLMNSS